MSRAQDRIVFIDPDRDSGVEPGIEPCVGPVNDAGGDPAGNGRWYRSGWIVCSRDRIIENGYVQVVQGRIRSLSGTKPRAGVTDLGPGVILPVLVNAHTHLELSALGGAVPMDMGFEAWVQALLIRREAVGKERLKAAAQEAAAGLSGLGTGVVGEVSTLGITRDILKSQGISGIWFQEILGAMEVESQLERSGNLCFSLAGHAPHTTGPDRLRLMKQITRAHHFVFSIHLAESHAESEFIDTGSGNWADFLASRGIDTSAWPVGDTTPVRYLDRLGILGPDTLAVHLLRADSEDLELLAQTGTRVCLCPRSNQALHGHLPDISTMLEKGIEPALGTDSLASCDSLSLFDEMAFLRQRYPGVRPGDVFAMATANGATALGLGNQFGQLFPGSRGCFLYADLAVSGKQQIFERLTSNEI